MTYPSEAFEKCVRSGGTIAATCACNRTHFVSRGDFGKGELEEYRRGAEENPDQYVEWPDDDFIPVGEFNDFMYVIGCECRLLGPIEEFIWNERKTILKYLRTRIVANKLAADQDAEAVTGLEESCP